jgi:hypothetical protein
MTETANLGLPLLEAGQAQKHVTHNEALAALDAIVMLSVADRDHNAPPAEPEEGARYLVKSAGSGGFAGKDDQIAHFTGGAFVFYPPRAGWLAYIEAESQFAVFDGEGWSEFGVGDLQGIELLGIGTDADETNPFSAKLNKVLWTARYAAEGGDGDLRYTLNKESSAKILSLLLQSNWSGRAEIGLVGNDHLSVKVSADGSAWTQAVSVNNASANLRLKSLTIGTDTLDSEEIVSIVDDSGSTKLFNMTSSGDTGFRFTRVSANVSGPSGMLRKARGTISSPAAPIQNDSLGAYEWRYYDGSAYRMAANVQVRVIAATPSSTDGQCRLILNTTASGAASPSENARFEHATGFSMYGANPVIDQNRHHRLRSYTVAGLPSASPAAQMIYVSDGTSNKRLAVSDGTNWRWPDGAVVS